MKLVDIAIGEDTTLVCFGRDLFSERTVHRGPGPFSKRTA